MRRCRQRSSPIDRTVRTPCASCPVPTRPRTPGRATRLRSRRPGAWRTRTPLQRTRARPYSRDTVSGRRRSGRRRQPGRGRSRRTARMTWGSTTSWLRRRVLPRRGTFRRGAARSPAAAIVAVPEVSLASSPSSHSRPFPENKRNVCLERTMRANQPGWPSSRNNCPAASYSPTQSPVQYHRRREA